MVADVGTPQRCVFDAFYTSGSCNDNAYTLGWLNCVFDLCTRVNDTLYVRTNTNGSTFQTVACPDSTCSNRCSSAVATFTNPALFNTFCIIPFGNVGKHTFGPFSISPRGDPSSSSGSSSLSAGAIAGIVLGALLLVALVILAAIMVSRRNKAGQGRDQKVQSNDYKDSPPSIYEISDSRSNTPNTQASNQTMVYPVSSSHANQQGYGFAPSGASTGGSNIHPHGTVFQPETNPLIETNRL
jgi:hypothetical protein